MHGTQVPARVREFARLNVVLAQARKAQKRRSHIYIRILSVVEDKVGREMLINHCTIAKAVGIDAMQIADLINAHQPLARIICNYQRKHGSTLAQRRMIQGPFVPNNL